MKTTWRCRFSLRSLLLLVLLVAGAFAWIAHMRNCAHRDRVIAEKIFDSSGMAFFESDVLSPKHASWFTRLRWKIIGERIVDVVVEGPQFSDFDDLSQLTHLEKLDLTGTGIRDLTPLQNLTELRSLRISWTEIRDISPLVKMQKMRFLILRSTNIDDISPLSRLRNLEGLDLCDTNVTDARPLAGLVNLEILELEDTLVNDVRPLKGLKNLETLRLSGIPVAASSQQVQQLREALPDCWIELVEN